MVLPESRGQGHLVEAKILMGLSEETRAKEEMQLVQTMPLQADWEGKKHPSFFFSLFFKYLPLFKHS